MSSRTSLIITYCLLGLFALARVTFHVEPLAFRDGTFISQVVRVESQTSFKDTYHSFRTSIDGREVRVVVDRYTVFQQGEMVRLSGSIRNTVLDNEQTVPSIYYPEIIPVKTAGILYQARIVIRERVRDAFGVFLPPEEVSLLVGIVFGINNGFSSKASEAFSVTGVMHVIAASGMNVTLLGGFISQLLGRYFRRRVALCVTIALLVGYAFLAGMGASIVRATVMGAIAFGAAIYGRQSAGKLALCATGLLMVIISPEIIYDVGFQLSFAATAGIIWLKNLIPQLPGKLGKLLQEDLGSTLAAQVATLPIILFYFQSVGLLSPMINVLVLWIVPFVMVIGLCAAIVGIISQLLGGCISLLAWPFLSYFLVVVKEGARISPVLDVGTLPDALIYSYYLLLFCIYRLFGRKRSIHAS